MERLARYGSGWIPWAEDAADIQNSIGRMRAAVSEFGRDADGIGVVGTLREVIADGRPDLAKRMERVPKMLEAGVTDFRIWLNWPDRDGYNAEQLSEIVAAFRDVAA
jgi:alkanesulfonate monooxygenase SsuD/methylene tetrahydromethanopterin reductase-like flavin-dependent oxidoreductase (luciferase family)